MNQDKNNEYVFKSKFQNTNYVFPEDKNIKKFMLNGNYNIIYPNILLLNR